LTLSLTLSLRPTSILALDSPRHASFALNDTPPVLPEEPQPPQGRGAFELPRNSTTLRLWLSGRGVVSRSHYDKSHTLSRAQGLYGRGSAGPSGGLAEAGRGWPRLAEAEARGGQEHDDLALRGGHLAEGYPSLFSTQVA